MRISLALAILSALFLVAGVASLGFVYLASLVELPGMLAGFSQSIAETNDIDILKKACLMAATFTEEDRISRLHWLLWGLGMEIVLASFGTLLSLWQIKALKATAIS